MISRWKDPTLVTPRPVSKIKVIKVKMDCNSMYPYLDYSTSEFDFNDFLDESYLQESTNTGTDPYSQALAEGVQLPSDVLPPQERSVQDLDVQLDFELGPSSVEIDPLSWPHNDFSNSEDFDQYSNALHCQQKSLKKRRRNSGSLGSSAGSSQRRFQEKLRVFEEEQLRKRFELLSTSLPETGIQDMSQERMIQASRDTGLGIADIEAWIQSKQATIGTGYHAGSLNASRAANHKQGCTLQPCIHDHAASAGISIQSGYLGSENAAFASTSRTSPISPGALFPPASNQENFSIDKDVSTFARGLYPLYNGNKVLCWLETLSVPEDQTSVLLERFSLYAKQLAHDLMLEHVHAKAGGDEESTHWTAAHSPEVDDVKHSSKLTPKLMSTPNLLSQLLQEREDPPRPQYQPTFSTHQQNFDVYRTPSTQTDSVDSYSSISSSFSIQEWAIKPRKGRRNGKTNREDLNAQIQPEVENTINSKYFCTYCSQNFSSASTWQRHELSKHTPSHAWICKPLQTNMAGHHSCIACFKSHINGDCEHGTKKCWDQDVEKRLFSRADSLTQHFRGRHGVTGQPHATRSGDSGEKVFRDHGTEGHVIVRNRESLERRYAGTGLYQRSSLPQPSDSILLTIRPPTNPIRIAYSGRLSFGWASLGGISGSINL